MKGVERKIQVGADLCFGLGSILILTCNLSYTICIKIYISTILNTKLNLHKKIMMNVTGDLLKY